MRFLHTVLVVLIMIAAPAGASPVKVTDLIEERAFAELGHVLPDNSRIAVRMAEGMISEGTFVQEFWMDAETGQFIANVVSEYGETHRVWGLAITTIEVPVPARRLFPDEIVQPTDVSIVEMPLQRLGTFAIQDADSLIGKQVRRMLVAGRPVPRQSVVPPRVITRGEKVKIILRHGGLSLTATGRAMADAHAGQPVRVVNLSSNKAINAIATGTGIVEVDQ